MTVREVPAELDTIAAAFARACEAVGIAYAFVGAFAVLAWGQPRTTSVIDVLVDLRVEQVQGLAEALDREGLDVEVSALRDAAREGSHVSVFTADPVLTVDIKPASDARERDEIVGASSIELADGRVRVVGAAETVAFKVLFGSEQDLIDARSIVARQGDRLDRARLSELARELGVGADVDDLLATVDAAMREQ